ncbi:MAG TPA: hypothetical protein VIT64_05990 [Ilumatobacteraceae bacterium]
MTSWEGRGRPARRRGLVLNGLPLAAVDDRLDGRPQAITDADRSEQLLDHRRRRRARRRVVDPRVAQQISPAVVAGVRPTQ